MSSFFLLYNEATHVLNFGIYGGEPFRAIRRVAFDDLPVEYPSLAMFRFVSPECLSAWFSALASFENE